MESIRGYLFLTAIFFLLFLAAAFLAGRYKKNFQLLKKVPWDTLGKIFISWTVILGLRKLLYYYPIKGVVQTKDSIWWTDTNNLYYLYGAVFMLTILLVIVIESTLKRFFKYLKEKTKKGTLAVNLVKAGLVTVFIIGLVVIEHNNFLREVIIKSLLPLKVISSGKYMGLFIALLLAYYMADGHKRLKNITIPVKKKNLKANVFIVSALFLIFLIITPIRFSGGWDKKFIAKLYDAQHSKNTKKFEDLLDGINSIKNEQYLNEAAVATSGAGWTPDTTKTTKDIKIRFDILKQIYLIASRSGNRYESEAVLKEMIDFVKPLEDKDKFRVLKEIERLTFKTGHTNGIVKVIHKEVLSAFRIEDPKKRVIALTKIAVDFAAMGYKNRVKDIFQQAVEQVNNIEYKRSRSLLLKEVAVAIAETGDTQWAAVVADGIVDKKIKGSALEEIRKRIEKK